MRKIRVIDNPDDRRVETGPLQVGDDWPGLFIRGDDAFGLSMYLVHAERRMKAAGDATADPLGLGLAGIRRLRYLLTQCIDGDLGDRLRQRVALEAAE